MDLVAALAIGAALVAAATAVGLVWRARQGRAVGGSGERVRPASLGVEAGRFGERATLVQFSTEFCSRCPAAARLLGGIADETPGARHVEVDLTHRADLARRFDVTQTPTTLIVDADGIVRTRIGGAPRADVVRARLDEVLGRQHVDIR
ncbi:thioredoxin family protein [Agromyces sp. H3Y2-19a]|jgi:thiol-disulfide isomerase/thioredoxin|uniref:TlpA family protein disulfide reductase n=1 Tax=Agromyces TaxID=33877 RepID=UPI0023B902EC|nr:thioredoxin family protein [Agromyces chromiiresistens]MDF0514941.1 thioredoxin family protein [Agromyces chromiiresistens]